MVEVMEKWKEIPGIAGYAVSDKGAVKRISASRGTRAGRLMKPHLAGRAKCYPTVNIRIDGRIRRFRVHRLVAWAFIGPPPSLKHEVAHRDGDPSNNNVYNLRWATPAENAADRIGHGRGTRGIGNASAKLSDDDVRAIRAASGRYADIAQPFGIDRHTVGDIKLRKTWAWLT